MCKFLSGGALLIMTAMCCWLRTPNRTSVANQEVIIVRENINHHHRLIY